MTDDACASGRSDPDACCGESERHDGEGQPCPTPQNWRQVLESFRAQADVWTAVRGARSIPGRTIGQGPPLIFLNGIGGTHELFVLTAWLLRDDFRCLLFDSPPPRAARRSDSSPAAAGCPAELDALAEDLLAVAAHHGLDRVCLYGAGLGAATALRAMSLAPRRVERAMLQTGFARFRLSPAERLAVRIGAWLPGRLRHVPFRRKIQEQGHRPWFPPFDATRFRFLIDDTGNVPVRVLARRAAALRKLDLLPALATITTPTLLIRTEGEGRLAAAAQDELQSGLPRATTEFLAGCGHLPYLTHPHRLAAVIRAFAGGGA